MTYTTLIFALFVCTTASAFFSDPVVSRAEPNIIEINDDKPFVEHSTFSLATITNHTRSKRAMSISSHNVRYPRNYLVQSRPPNDKWQAYLIAQHNLMRSKVPATNMRYVRWNDYLAQTAQQHADRCDFRHSKGRNNIGENIWAAGFGNYSGAVKLWFDEVYDRRCACPHYYKHCCGHYVQVAWADTHQMGCGMSNCRDIWGVQGRGHRNVLVCHYNPAGNTILIHPGGTYKVPAFRPSNSTHGACSECADGLKTCWNNKLCDY